MPHWKEQTCSHALRCQYLNPILALKDVGEHTTALMIVIRTKVHEASYNAMGSFEAPMQIHPSKRYLQFPFVLKVGQLFAAKQKHYWSAATTHGGSMRARGTVDDYRLLKYH